MCIGNEIIHQVNYVIPESIIFREVLSTDLLLLLSMAKLYCDNDIS